MVVVVMVQHHEASPCLVGLVTTRAMTRYCQEESHEAAEGREAVSQNQLFPTCRL